MKKANIFSNVNSHYCILFTALNLFQNYIRAIIIIIIVFLEMLAK